jgi:hypothetical protein
MLVYVSNRVQARKQEDVLVVLVHKVVAMEHVDALPRCIAGNDLDGLAGS